MTVEQCKSSLHSTIPAGLSVYLESLWYDGKGDWEKSHTLIQDLEDQNAAWIHAYLHRKEGDIGNADYWYSKAGKKRPSVSWQQEWENIVAAFIHP